MRGVRLLLTAAVLLGVVLPAAGQLRVEGNRQWWREVAESFDRLSRARTYRVRVQISNGPAGIGGWTWEFSSTGSAPASRMVMVLSRGGQEIRTETVQIGDQVYQRTSGLSGSPPRCVKLPAQRQGFLSAWAPPKPQDIKGTVRMLGKTAGAHRTPGGQLRPVYVYEFQVQPPGEPVVQNSLAVDRETGLPLRMTFRSTGTGGPGGPTGPGTAPPQAMTFDYYDHGAPIRITLPAGCPR